MKPSTRIIVNTGVMYGRMIITMVITLLSSRWILQALGQEDFGIYSLVGGILTLLLFLNLTMSTATQRFLSFSLGKGDEVELKETFYFSCILHLAIGFIIVILFEVIGTVLLTTVLQVPSGKESLSIFVLHCMAISVFASVIMVPYQACMISRENIVFVAIIQICEAILKLLISLLLLDFEGNRLKAYALAMMCVQFLLTVCYILYCRKNYPETKFRIHRVEDYSLLKQLSQYAGWNLIGSVSSLLSTQGISLLLNSFHGVIVNAAYGIATQVKGQLSFFSTSIVTSSRPQIVKSEGEGNRKRVLSLSVSTTKFSFLLVSLFAIPLIEEMNYVLTIWLKEVPMYTVDFTRLIIMTNLAYQLRLGITLPIESTGNIKKLQIYVGGLHFFVIPLGYLLLKMGLSPQSVLAMQFCETILSSIIALFISKEIAQLDLKQYIRRVLSPLLLAFVIVFALCYIPSFWMNESFGRLVFTCSISLIFTPLISYIGVLDNNERKIINNIINRIKFRK